MFNKKIEKYTARYEMLGKVHSRKNKKYKKKYKITILLKNKFNIVVVNLKKKNSLMSHNVQSQLVI